MRNPQDWNKAIIEEFRANKGLVGGNFAGMTLLLLHTTGAKSGLPRINPVAYTRDGERYVVIASKGGAPTNPDWYYNIGANPEVCVEVGTDTFRAQATVVPEPERSQLYDQMAAAYPAFAEYQRKTERTIPVIVLSRKEPQG
jgi:deazaflavin-dependent oxidoreductase (nitroreductase family)